MTSKRNEKTHKAWLQGTPRKQRQNRWEFKMRQTDRNLANRDGFSLAEVLIAIFVLAIGMLGILALFPLGAAQMAQAIKDERTGQLADLSEARMRIFWRQAWLVSNPTSATSNPAITSVGTLDTETNMLARCPEYAALDSPPGTTPAVNSSSSGPGWPMYLDPIGYPNFHEPGPITGTIVPRKTSSVTTTLAQRLQLFALIDDLSFNYNGQPDSPISRGDRYTAAFLLQRRKNNLRTEVNLHVVVYQGRSPDVASVEVPFTLTGNVVPGASSISASMSGIPLRLNSWILLSGSSPEPFADFYRVVGFTTTQLSVSPQIRTHGSGNSYAATATILTDVIEVFDRGTITPIEVAAP
jgi:prepilin-type N-terminal cleavage/methylation domain-containing protein